MYNYSIVKTASAQLKEINELKSPEKIIDALSNAPTSLKELVGYALHPNVEWLIPSGTPPYRAGGSVNEHMSTMPMLLNNVKTLYLYCKRPNDNLSQTRREMLFIQLLETVHPDDAQLLINIKDKIWDFPNITIRIAKIALPNQFFNVSDEDIFRIEQQNNVKNVEVSVSENVSNVIENDEDLSLLEDYFKDTNVSTNVIKRGRGRPRKVV